MRQFVLENQIVKNGLVVIDGKDFRYLRQVLRVKPGDMISVRLKSGELQNTTVAKIDESAKKITLQFCANCDDAGEKSITRGVQADAIDSKANAASNIEYWLFQFLPKPQKLELIVRQATECGVSVIVPVIGEYSEKSSVAAMSGASKMERIERIIREARQQSGSPVDTKLLEPMDLSAAIEKWMGTGAGAGAGVAGAAKDSLGVILSERNDFCENLGKVLSDGLEGGALRRVGVVVGSEGGISPDEVELLMKKGLYHPVHFDVNILRCETAALYGIAAVQTAITLNSKE